MTIPLLLFLILLLVIVVSAAIVGGFVEHINPVGNVLEGIYIGFILGVVIAAILFGIFSWGTAHGHAEAQNRVLTIQSRPN